MSSYLQVYRQ